mmetsp:Transcript_635/g.814  ORF Transcript_635/g.814 Transcript_635/m.814 type:complete len:243 (-) Transcript_635:396-1124(-)|eukprot:CAMPEP_0117742306 /NCGR_PEP_ID=MMETSP0947-20121206/5472_1 /TAXON_ID=44440 /ORGANISM="Chattonella subsalsa, Strain CCMP2191" /LENGTH=242 /DNA_ID=CAMNT_0005558813 /DNA_START=186 /DNA_END=914 /DNA_ORIENTATION=+
MRSTTGSARRGDQRGGALPETSSPPPPSGALGQLMSRISYPRWWPESLKVPENQIRYSWFCSMGLTAILFMIGCGAASFNNNNENGFSGAAFAIIWLLLCLIAVSVYGTFVMLKWKAQLSVGILLGCVFMMTQMLFIMFVLFAGLAAQNDGSGHHLDRSVSFFCFLLLVNYIILFIVLMKYRSALYGEDGDKPLLNAPPPPVPSKSNAQPTTSKFGGLGFGRGGGSSPRFSGGGGGRTPTPA